MEWLLKKLGLELAKEITFGEYKRIKEENRKSSEYREFIRLLEKIAETRSGECKRYEFSKECPQTAVIWDYTQEGKTSRGTAPLRIFTIMGSDGQIINIQGFDLSETVKYTVRHTNGKMDLEELDAAEAMKRIRREAGYSPAAH